MPEFRSLTRQVPIESSLDLLGEQVKLTFDANALTPFLLSEMQQRLDAGDVLAVASMLERVLMAWDVTDEGQPFPPTAKNISRFSVSALAALSRLIGEHAAPSDAEGNASSPSASGPPAASEPESPSSLNGSDTSTSQTPSASPSLT